jgi:hypothetical protein
VFRTVVIVVRVLSDLIGGVALTFRQRVSLEAEVLFLRRQLALYVGAAGEASSARCGNAGEFDAPVAVVRMPLGAGCGATRDLDSLAPSRIQALLEVEVSLRTPADSA